jgi:hypothetical protein
LDIIAIECALKIGYNRSIETKEANKMKYSMSTICRVANILAHSMTRSQAFKISWSMAKGRNIEKVKGVQFGNRQAAIAHLTHYSADAISISLIRESGNRYDTNAIAVSAEVSGHGSYKMGYLESRCAALVAPIMDKGISLKAGLKSIVGGFCEGMSYGLRLQVAI